MSSSDTSPILITRDDLPEDFNIYFYNPSVPVAIVFSVLYLLQVAYHFYLAIWVPCIRGHADPKHRYTIPLFVAAAISTFGYSVRVASASGTNKSNVTLYAISSSWVVIAPIFVCAALYWMVARLIQATMPDAAKTFFALQPKTLGIVFIVSDVLSFMTQGAGSGIAASNNWTGSTKTVGTTVLIAGLALQFTTFSLYLAVLGQLCLRAKKGGALVGYGARAGERVPGFSKPVRKVIIGMWIASGFVWIRSLYRLVEFGLGIDGYPFQHEWMLWVFEAAPMWIALAVLGWFHPVKLLQHKSGAGFIETKITSSSDNV